MRYPPSCFALLSCSLLTFAWAGCALPVSVHPASDAETSSTDEKLVGIWEKVLTEKERAEYVADGETHSSQPFPVPFRMVVGKHPDEKNLHQIAVSNLNDEGVIVNALITLHSAQLGKQRVMSFILNPDKPKEEQVYLLLFYKYVDDRQMELRFLDAKFLGNFIEKGELSGIVKREERKPDEAPDAPPRYREVKITAPTKELATFLEKNGEKLITKEQPLVMRKVGPQL